MDIVSIVFQVILSLSILVVLHEFGHYLPAKWFKTRVEKFYLFFNPYFSLFKKQIGETEWGIGWVPFGGYVKIAGMIDESMDKEQLEQPVQPWEFRAKPAWQRLIIMVGGVVVNFILGFLIFAGLLYFYGETYYKNSDLKYGIMVDSLGMELGLEDGDKLVSIGGKPVDRFSRGIFTEEIVFNNASSFEVNRKGSEITLQVPANFAQKLTAPSNKNKGLILERYPQQIAKVNDKSIAEKAGLKKDDKILSVNGRPTIFINQLSTELKKHKNEEVKLVVLRAKDTLQMVAALDSNAAIGAALYSQDKFLTISREKYSFAQAIPAGVDKGISFLTNQIKAFGQMFKGNIKAKDSLGSVLSIATLFDASWSWERFWTITAMLSIILAFFNILPIPALDGGYVLFLLWEIVTGKKPSDRFMEIVTTAGFVVLITLMIFALGLDINRLFQ
ncbi:MAG TPA: RIP metalloprotease RseP [Saprospiraceae bacterium]|nr:RIP metalloprotease RseP [Saprospiraceae bacterium]HPN68713.1 RIP metalloprotease RseP [Saprospiraceae bacterium]